MADLEYADVRVRTLGKLITSYEGRVQGPRFGEVYTVAKGEAGYIAGYRSEANQGIGFIGREWHAMLKAAQDAAVRMSDN